MALPQAPASPPSGLKMRMRHRPRPAERDELVAADAGAAVGQGGDAARRQAQAGRPFVDHDEIVAGAVHLVEGDAHAAAYSPGLLAG